MVVFQLFSRLNKLGLTMSTTSKLRLLDEAGNYNMTELLAYLKTKPLLKITGDNLDVFIKVCK